MFVCFCLFVVRLFIHFCRLLFVCVFCLFLSCLFQVCAQNKTHSVYIWIHLKPGADLRACARVAATLQQKVHVVSPDENDDDDSISAGVGFGPNFYKQVPGFHPEVFF